MRMTGDVSRERLMKGSMERQSVYPHSISGLMYDA